MEELGVDLENISLGDLGRAKKLTIDKDNTTISLSYDPPNSFGGSERTCRDKRAAQT